MGEGTREMRHDNSHLEDWFAETSESIAARLDGVKAAQSQMRLTLGLMAAVSMMMLISAYNAYLSFDSRWILAQANRPLGTQTVADVLTIRALQDWADSRNAMVSLLGIRVSVDDAPVLGTSSLFVFSLWLLLLMRRENHSVGLLLRDTDTVRESDVGKQVRHMYSSGQRWLILHAIDANSLFVTFEPSLARVRSLSGRGQLTAHGVMAIGKTWLSRLGLEFVRGFFFWFPSVASVVVFCLDRWSYFRPDPFEPYAAIPGTSAPLFWGSIVVFLACWIPLLMCCGRANQYSRATEAVLHEYGHKLRADLLREQQLSRQP